MNKAQINIKLLSRVICALLAAYGIVFFTLGSAAGTNKVLVWMYFIIDVLICAALVTCSILLFFAESKVLIERAVVFLLISLFLCAFTYFAFLVPECGLPPYLFSVK